MVGVGGDGGSSHNNWLQTSQSKFKNVLAARQTVSLFHTLTTTGAPVSGLLSHAGSLSVL